MEYVRTYRELEAGEGTVIAADPAEEGGDYCAAVVKSRKHKDTVLVFEAQMKSAQFGYELERIARYVQRKAELWPMIGVERNTGAATIASLELLNYPNLFRMPKPGEDQPTENDKVGWHTNTASRRKMLDELSLSLKQEQNGIFDERTIEQLQTFVMIKGKAQASTGNNDDLVMAEAIAWQLLGYKDQMNNMGDLVAAASAFGEDEPFG